MAELRKKEVKLTIGGKELVIPTDKKVKEVADAAGVEIPVLKIDPESCKGCQLCVKVCESNAITGNKKEPHEIDPGNCVRCGECLAQCKTNSIVPA